MYVAGCSFVDECALEVHLSCVSLSASPRSYCAQLFDAPSASAFNYFLKMHTEIIECRPPKTDHGILGRARSAAALALTSKPDRNVKKSVAKVWTTF